MHAHEASHQGTRIPVTPMPTKPGRLSALQWRLWRAMLRAEALLAPAEGEALATQLKVLNRVSQVCLSYLSRIKSQVQHPSHPAIEEASLPRPNHQRVPWRAVHHLSGTAGYGRLPHVAIASRCRDRPSSHVGVDRVDWPHYTHVSALPPCWVD